MPYYRKKPVVIEAVQFNPDAKMNYEWEDKYEGVRGTSYNEIHELLQTSGCSKEEPYYNWDRLGIIVTMHGQRTVVVPGDYIIPDGKPNTFYPCKPDIFEKTYEPAEDPKQKQ